MLYETHAPAEVVQARWRPNRSSRRRLPPDQRRTTLIYAHQSRFSVDESKGSPPSSDHPYILSLPPMISASIAVA